MAIPFNGIGHRRRQFFQIVSAAPADVVMFFRCKFYGGRIFWSRPINQADVLVRVVDAVDVEKARRDERAGAG